MLFQFYFFKEISRPYSSKSERIYDKDQVHQSENISISQNFITCLFCNLHFLAKNMYQKYTKIGKLIKYLGKQKYLTLKMSQNAHNYIKQKDVLDKFLP